MFCRNIVSEHLLTFLLLRDWRVKWKPKVLIQKLSITPGRGSTIAEIAKHRSAHTCVNGLTKTMTDDPRSANETELL